MTESTKLPAATHIPWREDFELGYGIEYPSGSIAERVVEVRADLDKLLANTTIKDSDFSTLDLSKSKDRKTALGLGASVTFSAYGVEASLQSDLRREMSSSSNTRTLIVQHDITWNDIDLGPESVTLTEPAAKLVEDFDPTKWREHFGDYYISGFVPEARFIAMFRLTTDKAELRNSFSAEVSATVEKGDKSGALTAKMEWDKYTSDSGSDLTCTIYQVGVDESVLKPMQTVSPDGVWEVYERFVENARPNPGVARLRHCVSLAPDLGRTVAISSEVIRDIEGMYFDIVDARSDAEGLPTAAREAMLRELDDLDRTVRGTPLTGTVEAMAHLDACEEELGFIKRWGEYHRLWKRLRERPDLASFEGSRKKAGQQKDFGEGSGLWTYMEPPQVLHVEYSKPGRIRRSVKLECPKGCVITRYRVTSERSKNGKVALESGGLLKDHATFSVESQYDRGVNWRFEGWMTEDDKFRKFEPGT